MKIDILASGSGGNCIALRSGETTILIDAGIAKTKIEKKLLDVGIRPDSIKAIFITHAHADHIKGAVIANKYNIPVFAAEGEWKGIVGVSEDLKRPFKAGTDINIEDYFIESFHTFHDAMDPVGYAVHDENGFKCSICLDTGHVDQTMLSAMEYSNVYIIEANHEPSMLEYSDYPNSVKARILSNVGHLSNEQTAEALSKLLQGVGEQIYLTHLSSKNNLPELAKMTVQRVLVKKGFKLNQNFSLEVL
ncbi:MBL fold metallo-hydrolase [Cytobacillus firmus]|uniref:MBL fold metallo-hydrolase n=1 Tax=Cytobacillus firmus TaxID=1399 RepID=UPI0022284896|nr:MBL fold metallo-hydrolase [Cytobacillus firmus]